MLTKYTYLAFIFACAAVTTNAFASSDSAIKLLSEKKFDQARNEFAVAAEAGDPKAQYLLGIGLLQGKYFPKNEEEGLRLLRASSDAGNGHASFALFRYLSQGGKHPLSATIPLLEKAALQGDLGAKLILDNVVIRRDGMTAEYGALDRYIPIEVHAITRDGTLAALQNGQAVFRRSCAACHESGIAGAPKISDSARWADLGKKGFETLVDHAIQGFKMHPPRGGAFDLGGDDIRDAVFFMSTPRQP